MNTAQTQHIEWLTEQLQDSKNKLVEAQKTVAEAKKTLPISGKC
jgi:hypothetical protein